MKQDKAGLSGVIRKVGPETGLFFVHKEDAFSEHNMTMKSFHIVHSLGLNVSGVSKTDTCL